MLALIWIAFPALVAAICLGCGLLVDRLAGGTLPRVLLAPTGFAAALVLATSLTVLDATAELAAPALAVAALAGFALLIAGRGRGGGALRIPRPRRDWLWPVLAAALPAAAIAAPVVLTGAPGFTGYMRIIDLAFQLDLAAHVVEHGRSLAGVTRGSSHGSVIVQLLEAGYPTGAQAGLGTLAQLGGIDPIWAWQPFMAVMGALLGLALYALLGRAIAHPGARALAAAVAAQPTILFSYALASGIKELAAALLVALLAALLAGAAATARRLHGSDGVSTMRRALPAGIVIAAGLCVVNVGFLPWAVVLLALALGPAAVAQVRSGGARRRLPAPALALALALAALVVVPTVLAAAKLAPLLRSGGPQDLGNLTAPLPAWSTLGPWLTPDHRYPLAVYGTQTLTALLAVLVALLALLGLARAARGRDRGIVAAALAAGFAVAVTVWRGSAWVELKAFTISAPLVVAVAFAGAAALASSRHRLARAAAAPAALAVAAAIVGGNALVYQSTPLAPYDRLAQLERLGSEFGGEGPALHTTFDEYAGYLMRAAGLVSLVHELDRDRPEGAAPVFARDLDTFTPAFLRRFRLIVVRRGDPHASRPPADFEHARRSRHYDVYRRIRAAPAVASHIALQATADARRAPTCRMLRAQLRRAGPDARVAYAPARDAALHPAPDAAVPSGWLVDGPERLARGPGRMRYPITIEGGGAYGLWLRGSFGRRVSVTIDGRAVGSARWAENYPLQYEPLGSVRLRAGRHVVDIVRGGGTLLPGTGNDIGPEGTTSRIGPLALIRAGTRPVVRIVDPAAGLRICASARPLDWLEVVRG